jgi:hypothetical protein
MGKEIVYCAECGKRLQQDDFDHGRASLADHRPYCHECRGVEAPPPRKAAPPPLPVPTPPPGRISSTRLPVLAASTTRRGAPRTGARRTLYFGIGGGMAALAFLGAFLSRPSEDRAPLPAPTPAAAGDRGGQALRAVAQLEALQAREADAAALLEQCERARETVRGTPYEARLRNLEARLLEQKREREREQQVTRAIDDARKILGGASAIERKADVLALLRAVRSIAGPRVAEVDRLIHEAECLREGPEVVPPPRGTEGRVLLRETFEQGMGRFKGGTLADGGWNGSRALAVPPSGVWVEQPLPGPVTPSHAVRFRLKPLFEAKGVQVIFWSPKVRGNYWYRPESLRPQEWNAVEFRVAKARLGYHRKGPSAEGDTLVNLKIYFDDPAPNGRLLLDDFEIVSLE